MGKLFQRFASDACKIQPQWPASEDARCCPFNVKSVKCIVDVDERFLAIASTVVNAERQCDLVADLEQNVKD